MQAKKAILLGFLVSIFAVGANAIDNGYTDAEIYLKMCSKCHGQSAEGNPAKKGPALNDQTAHELEISLYDLKSGGLNQSSGTEHEVMEHNMKKIIEKGMNYEPKSMANFIFTTYNPEAKYYKDINEKKDYSVSEIYAKMCSKCHGINGEGNPKKKGPALNDKTAHEIEVELIDIRDGGLNQSSGTEHEIMEHNQNKIEEKGMKYDPKDMAKYIETYLYKN
ncbi:MAG: c-type cytochrome [Halarcobacter sp.]